MFKDQNRLRSPNAVRRPSRYGKGVRSKHMGLKHIQSHIKGPRFAVVVSKKVSKSAVTRNRIKRRIVEVVRQNYLSKIDTHLDIAIFAYDIKLAKMDSQELALEINQLLQKAKIIK